MDTTMGAIKKTSTIINDTNLSENDSHIYITRKDDARAIYSNWKKGTYNEIPWSKYQIKETDMRAKTATFSSPQYLDLTTGQYLVMISSKLHEDFGGPILTVEYDESTGLYDYQCQDYSRYYQGKFELLINGKTTLYRLLKNLMTRGEIPLRGNDSKQVKKYKDELSGLLPRYQYNQKYWGKGIDYNPFEWKNKLIIKNKSWIEAIRDIVYGTGMFVDVHFNKFGAIQIEPYWSPDLYKTGLKITTPEVANRKFTFDTTNVVTGVVVHNTDKTQGGTYYGSKQLVNLDLSAFFGDMTTSIDNPNKSTTKTTSDKKQSQNTKTPNNPYNTKKKKVYLTTDNISSASNDKKFMNDVAKLLQKEGWKTTVGARGPNAHYKCKVKDGVWFMIFGGADAALFKQCGGSNAFTKRLKQMNSRAVIGMHGGGDIRKGGKYYNYLPRAHDDNYSPSSFKGLSKPLNYLTKNKVSIMYAGNAKEMVAKFLKGGDNTEAL